MLNISILTSFAVAAAVAAEKKDLQVLKSCSKEISGMVDTIKMCRDLLNILYLQGNEAVDKNSYQILEEFGLYFD